MPPEERRLRLLIAFAAVVPALMLALLAIPIAGLTWLAATLLCVFLPYESRAPEPVPGSPPPPARRSTESRLAELEALRAAGAITGEEYAAKRAAIIDQI